MLTGGQFVVVVAVDAVKVDVAVAVAAVAPYSCFKLQAKAFLLLYDIPLHALYVRV